jgi:transcriptional regulator GlxA family with amidase domain
MRNHNKLILLALLLTAFAILACGKRSDVYASQAGKQVYVCPPCGCDKDGETFDHDGTCPSCGMHLAEKGSLANRPAPSTTPRKQVAILIFEGVEIIDYTGPWETFGHAGFKVFTVAQKADPVTNAFGMKVIPDYTFADHPKPDVLLIPGGNVIQAQKDPQTLKWIQEMAGKAEIVLSVCNGAYILAHAGLLNGLTATTTAPLIDGLANVAPNIKVVHDKRFVDNGKVITSGGLSAGIDGALHVVERLRGREAARQTAAMMEYRWQPEP